MNKMELENLNNKRLAQIDENRLDKQYFTLEEYASEFFNSPGERKTKSGVISNINKKKLIPLWAKVSPFTHWAKIAVQCLDTPLTRLAESNFFCVNNLALILAQKVLPANH